MRLASSQRLLRQLIDRKDPPTYHALHHKLTFTLPLILRPAKRLSRKTTMDSPEMHVIGQRGFSPTEVAVSEIWRDTFNLTTIGADDDFFAFGADSVVASRVLSQIGSLFSVEVPLSLIFEFPRLREFCRQVD